MVLPPGASSVLSGATLFWYGFPSPSCNHFPTTSSCLLVCSPLQGLPCTSASSTIAGRRCTCPMTLSGFILSPCPPPSHPGLPGQEETFFPSSKPCLPSRTSGARIISLMRCQLSQAPRPPGRNQHLGALRKHRGKARYHNHPAYHPATSRWRPRVPFEEEPKASGRAPQRPLGKYRLESTALFRSWLFWPVVCNNCAIFNLDFYR